MGIHGGSSRRGVANLVTMLHQVINAVWETGHIADQWRGISSLHLEVRGQSRWLERQRNLSAEFGSKVYSSPKG